MVFVVGNTGIRLMPTSEYRARKLMSRNRAVVYKHRPFTIQLLDCKSGGKQPVEYTSDVGSYEAGISVKSEKHAYREMQADMLPDEREKHNDRARYRRTRRNRKRHRKPRFDNRKKPKGWLPSSIRHKMEAQVRIFSDILEVCPITEAYFEMGKFDTQALKALEAGDPLPQGEDYQHGERYRTDTLRKAVFARDGYKCLFCGRGIREKALLHVHHIGFWRGDRSNRLSNLGTACELCHTPPEHQPGGKLYGIKPKLKSLAGAAFMNEVRWQMLGRIKALFPEVHATYGVTTQREREARNLPKSHTNDAYCIGRFRPRHRTAPMHMVKARRNDRILQKFYDAVYIDSRDAQKKSGKELFNGRISRNHKKDSENLHPYRKKKIRKGHVSIRRGRTQVKAGSAVLYKGERMAVHGTHTCYRKSKKSVVPVKRVNVEFTTAAPDGRKSASLEKCTVLTAESSCGWKMAAE